ncbi:MAG TPA: trypsin-like peptidase domain-containing protein, partial [Thermomicrobiales bacterium]|nr:trypsin-like peptidase domain-containing protein [Thermomicrobiales bacterium]
DDVREWVPLGDSDDLRQGETIVAIGSPLGAFTNTVTSGIISALGRNDFGAVETNCQNYSNLIQHDAPINPGNSGGPLFNLRGEVVGVNTLGLPVTEDGTPIQGLFFAVPSNMVREIAEQLQADGRISAPYLGIESIPIDPATAQQIEFEQIGAIYVDGVTPGTPADDAGIREGDILIQIDDQSITAANSLPQILLGYEPGDEVEITLIREGQEVTVDLTFGNIPDEVLALCEAGGAGG